MMTASPEGSIERPQVSQKQVYVVRHGESTFNTRQDRDGDPLDFDARLTDRGCQQAATVASHIIDLAPDLIVSSPLTRALQTAQIVARGRVPVLVEPLVREWQLRSCDIGRPASILQHEFPAFSFAHLPERWWYEDIDGESAEPRDVIVEPRELFFDRVHQFRRWLQRHPAKNIVVVGHYTFFIYLAKRKLGNCELVPLIG